MREMWSSPSLPGSTSIDRKSTRLNSSHVRISYAVFCLKKKINYYIISLTSLTLLLNCHLCYLYSFSFLTYFFFFFNDTATTEIYTLSLHDALPIFNIRYLNLDLITQIDYIFGSFHVAVIHARDVEQPFLAGKHFDRSEEHTSELQSRPHLVCRLLLEKKNKLLYNFSHFPHASSQLSSLLFIFLFFPYLLFFFF